MTARADAIEPSVIPRSTKALITFLDAMHDRKLFGQWFDPPSSWAAWSVVAKALFGEPMSGTEFEVFSKITGRSKPPVVPFREAYFAVGRRGGKSLFAAALATYAAAFRDYRAFLKPGHHAVVMVLAADKAQARQVFSYIGAFFDHVPMLGALVESRTQDSITLGSRLIIQVQAASFRRIRGRTVVCAILDEIAYWMNDENSQNPDREIVAAIKPSMATIPNRLFVALSSPYARRGVLWESFQRYFGADDATTLFIKADTATMNPSIDQAYLDDEYQKDPATARAEYGAEFREDLESYVSQEAVARVTVRGRASLPYSPGKRHFAFCDPAGGSGQDSMTLAIARLEGDKNVLVRLVERRPPFSPEDAIAEQAAVLKAHELSSVTGDHYAGDWPKERFRVHGVTYQIVERTKSDLYQAFLPLVNEGKVELLDDARMLRQLLALEKRTGPSGKDTISHPSNGHDDLINAAAGALTLVKKRRMFEDLAASFRNQSAAGNYVVETQEEFLQRLDEEGKSYREVMEMRAARAAQEWRCLSCAASHRGPSSKCLICGGPSERSGPAPDDRGWKR
jgi:terminase large subunit-like protein